MPINPTSLPKTPVPPVDPPKTQPADAKTAEAAATAAPVVAASIPEAPLPAASTTPASTPVGSGLPKGSTEPSATSGIPEGAQRIVSRDITDLSKVRIPGLDKPFEQLTISELVQLKPDDKVASNHEVTAVTDNVSYTSDSSLDRLARVRGLRDQPLLEVPAAMQAVKRS